MVTLSSSTALRSTASTSSGVSSGRMRQLIRAPAVWGSAFSACPPSRPVATQVVRITAFHCARGLGHGLHGAGIAPRRAPQLRGEGLGFEASQGLEVLPA